jgi:hypothetical protein
MQHKGMELITALIRQMRPATLNNLPFQDPSRALILEMTGFHVDKCHGFAPSGKPRYLTGKLYPFDKKANQPYLRSTHHPD